MRNEDTRSHFRSDVSHYPGQQSSLCAQAQACALAYLGHLSRAGEVGGCEVFLCILKRGPCLTFLPMLQNHIIGKQDTPQICTVCFGILYAVCASVFWSSHLAKESWVDY